MSEMTKFIPLLLVITGTLNILLISYADNIKAVGSDGYFRSFQHPFLQAAFMFIGQIIGFIVFKLIFLILQRRRNGSEDTHLLTSGQREFSLLIFLLPALCDAIASSMLFVGIFLTYPLSFQMLRGTSLIFVAIFGVIYINKTLKTHNWLGMATIVLGTILVCIADIKYLNMNDGKAVLTGDMLIICAQVLHSVKYVYDEKHIKSLDIPPLQAVGWQGIYSFLIIVALLIPLNYLKVDTPFGNNPNNVAEDIIDGFTQLFSSVPLIVAHVLFIISSAIYSFTATCVIKDASAINMIIIDSVRVVFLWFIALFQLQLGYFNFLAILSFIVLLSGIFIYRNVVFVPTFRWIFGRITRRRYGDIDSIDEIVNNNPADAI